MHLNPTPDGLRDLYRIDGVLQPQARVPAAVQQRIVSRIKVVAGLLTYRKDIAQYAQIPGAQTGGGDVRVSIFPTVHGNNMGMQRAAWVKLGRFDEDVLIGSDDVELSMRAWLEGVPVSFVGGAVVHYRYRPEPRALWRQGRSYGRSRPLVVRRLRDRGLACPGRFAGWRSWVWLLLHIGSLASPNGRARWLWVAGNRVGHVEGSIRYRSLFL